VDAGGVESGYPEWAVGSLTTTTDPDGFSIEISDGLLGVSHVDIDANKTVRVWVDEPNSEHGHLAFPVSRIAYD